MKKKQQPSPSRCGVTSHTVASAVEGHGPSSTEFYRALKSGELAGRKRGRIWYVRCEDIEAWMDATSVPNLAELERGA